MDEFLYPAEKVADVMGEVKQQLFDTWNSQQVNTQPNTGGEAWGGWYPPTEPKHVCPHCGYCPHCGRGGGFVPNYPLPYQPWPGYPWSAPIWVSSQATSANTPDYRQVYNNQ